MEIYKLRHPIEYGEKKIAEVSLRRLKVKDMNSQEREIKIIRSGRGIPVTEDDPITSGDLAVYNISKITSLPVEAVEELDLADFNDLSEKTSNFFGSEPTTDEGS